MPRNNIPQQEKPVSLSVVLPGLLDRASYSSNELLSRMLRKNFDRNVVELDMFELPGVRRSLEKRDTYHCDWTPAQYLLAIKEAIESARKSYSVIDVELIGFSYGAQIALLFAIADSGMDWQLVSRIVAIMPSNYYHWERYDSNRDWQWHLEQYHRYGLIDLKTPHLETRSKILNDLSSETYRVAITRKSIASHMQPFDGLLKTSPVLVSVPSLVDSGLLSNIKAKTLVVSGTKNELAPDSVESVANIYGALPRKTQKDFVNLTGVQHDYRGNQAQINLVNDAIQDWLLSN